MKYQQKKVKIKMCRGSNHGGRRCPNDNSTARRLRRTNSNLVAHYSGTLTAPSIVKTINELPEQKLNATIEDIKLNKIELDLLKDKYWINDPYSDSWYDKIQGDEEYRKLFLDAKNKIEQGTIKLGTMIYSLASQRTGFTDEIIKNTYAEELKIAEEKLLNKEEEIKKFLEQAHIKLNVRLVGSLYALHSELYNLQTANPPFENQELVSKYLDLTSELILEKRKVIDELNKVTYKGSEKSTKMIKANQQELKNILSEIRPMGGSLVVHPDSNKNKLKMLESTLSIFPASWIEASNKDGNKLIIKATTARAHYIDSKSRTKYKMVHSGSLAVSDEDTDETIHQRGWIPVEVVDGQAVYTGPDGVKHIREVPEGKKAYYAPDFKSFNPFYHSKSSDGTPKGRGWEKVIIKVKDVKTGEIKEEETWRKAVISKISISTESQTADLLVDETLDTAMHEFVHRAEAKIPNIGLLESIFIKRRTTLENGNSEPMVKLFRNKKEYARVDNFVSNYMGKHYEDNKHWEVLSTGVEAVFGENYGNFLGIGKYKKIDTEHRDFVIGTLAHI